MATLTAIVIGLGVALGLTWLGSNLVDERLSPAAQALLAPRPDPLAPADNLFVALMGWDAPRGDSMIRGNSWLWTVPSIWQAAKTHRTEVAALIAANLDLYRRYVGMHDLHGYFDSASPGRRAPDFLVPFAVQKLFLVEAAVRLQSGTPAQQEAALADLGGDVRMWKSVLDGYGGLLSKIMAAVSLHADFLLLGDMVTDPGFHPALPGDEIESLVAPFPLQEWKIGGAYGWEMRNFAPTLEAVTRPDTTRATGAPPAGWLQRANRRISAQFIKLHATENLDADWMRHLRALADGDPGSFIERRDAYRKWESGEFPLRVSWYNPVGRMLVAIGARSPYDDYPARVFDIAAFQRLVYLAYRITRDGVAFEGIPAFMKSHPQWSTHPVDAQPFYWNPADGTLGVRQIGGDTRGARFSLRLAESRQPSLSPRPAPTAADIPRQQPDGGRISSARSRTAGR